MAEMHNGSTAFISRSVGAGATNCKTKNRMNGDASISPPKTHIVMMTVKTSIGDIVPNSESSTALSDSTRFNGQLSVWLKSLRNYVIAAAMRMNKASPL